MIDLPPADRLLSLREVLTRVGMSSTTLYRRLKDGQFPRPVRHGAANLWRESTITAWIVALPEHGGSQTAAPSETRNVVGLKKARARRC